MHQVLLDIHEEGSIDLATMDDPVVSASNREGGGEDVDGPYPGPLGVQGTERLLVRVGSVGCQDDELLHTSAFPGTHEVVEQTMEGLGMGGGASRIVHRGRRIGAIFYGGCSEYLKLGGEVVSQPLNDDGVAAKGEMRTMLFGRANRDDEARIVLEVGPHLAR